MVITLCGSTRFEDQFIIAQRELSRRGILCFGLAVLPQHRLPDEDWKDGSFDKTIADLLYYDRILNSEAILVLGDGYIGPSTAKEILWAYIKEKGVFPHHPDDDWENTVEVLRSRDWSVEGEVLVGQAMRFLKGLQT